LAVEPSDFRSLGHGRYEIRATGDIIYRRERQILLGRQPIPAQGRAETERRRLAREAREEKKRLKAAAKKPKPEPRAGSTEAMRLKGDKLYVYGKRQIDIAEGVFWKVTDTLNDGDYLNPHIQMAASIDGDIRTLVSLGAEVQSLDAHWVPGSNPTCETTGWIAELDSLMREHGLDGLFTLVGDDEEGCQVEQVDEWAIESALDNYTYYEKLW
jgi:hypothetical protein